MKPLIIALGLLLISCKPISDTLAKEPYLFQSDDAELEAVEIYKGKDAIWGFDFLPDGKILFTERRGRMNIFDPQTSKLVEVSGVPEVAARNQGGLLDVLVHPRFAENRIIYLTYSAFIGEGMTTVLAKAELDNDGALTNLSVLFTAQPVADADHHFGSRVVLSRAGNLYVSVGDRGSRDQAQNLGSHFGKILRLKQDGRVPEDNPYISTPGAKPEIWSYGHRNVQGMTVHPQTGEIWAQEHGPRGGDEINRIKKGHNYGWPEVTRGREYWGPRIGEGFEKEGMTSPVHYWVPSIAPSGLAFYHGKKIPHWQGSLFSGALVLTHLNRLVIANNKVIKEERLLGALNKRVRAVKQGPDELLYISTDDGALIQIRPVDKGADSQVEPD